MTEFEAFIRTLRQQQAPTVTSGSARHAFVMRSGNRMALEIGARDGLEMRMHDWLKVVGAGQKGGVVSPHIEDCAAACVTLLLASGLEVEVFFKETDGQAFGGPHVE